MSDDTIPQKRCHKCGELRPVVMFARNTRAKDGLDNRCKICETARYRANEEAVKARAKAYRENNAEQVRAKKKEYSDAHKAEKSAYDRARYEALGAEIRARVKAYREANPDLIRERKKKYQRENREKLIAYLREWYKANVEYRRENAERLREKARLWAQANPHKIAIRRHKRRAHIIANGGNFSLDDYLLLIEIQGDICAYCHRADKMTIEHIIPVSRGGRHELSNICLACKSCNSSKGDKMLHEWVDRWYLRGR